MDNADVLVQQYVDFKSFILRRAHSTEQTAFTRVIPSGIDFSTESNGAMQIVLLKDTITDTTRVWTVDRSILIQKSYQHDQYAQKHHNVYV